MKNIVKIIINTTLIISALSIGTANSAASFGRIVYYQALQNNLVLINVNDVLSGGTFAVFCVDCTHNMTSALVNARLSNKVLSITYTNSILESITSTESTDALENL